MKKIIIAILLCTPIIFTWSQDEDDGNDVLHKIKEQQRKSGFVKTQLKKEEITKRLAKVDKQIDALMNKELDIKWKAQKAKSDRLENELNQYKIINKKLLGVIKYSTKGEHTLAFDILDGIDLSVGDEVLYLTAMYEVLNPVDVDYDYGADVSDKMRNKSRRIRKVKHDARVFSYETKTKSKLEFARESK